MPLDKTSKDNVIALLVLDVVPGILTVIGNLVFLTTLIRTTSLHKPSNVIIAGLCVSDLLVGFVVRPLYASFLYLLLKGKEHEILKFAFNKALFFCAGLSFCFATLLSLERYVAVCNPFTYRRKVTFKRQLYTTIFLGSIWLVYASLNMYPPISVSALYNITTICCLIVCILVVLLTYFEIYCQISNQRKRRAALGITSINKAVRERRERSTTFMIGMVLACFLLCYTPLLVMLGYFAQKGNFCWNDDVNFQFSLWVNFLLLTNSCINPIIYCTKSSDIRRAATNLIFR